jgi:YggT family protein
MAGLINTVLNIMIFAIVARSILSFVVPMAGARPHPVLLNINAMVNQLTEPILAPIRRVMPRMGMLDFSPMVAIVILVIIRAVVGR